MPLRLHCCEFSFCQSEPGYLSHCSALLRRNRIFFFFFTLLLSSWQWMTFLAHQWVDLIRTFWRDKYVCTIKNFFAKTRAQRHPLVMYINLLASVLSKRTSDDAGLLGWIFLLSQCAPVGFY